MGSDAFNWHCDGNTTQANLAWRVATLRSSSLACDV